MLFYDFLKLAEKSTSGVDDLKEKATKYRHHKQAADELCTYTNNYAYQESNAIRNVAKKVSDLHLSTREQILITTGSLTDSTLHDVDNKPDALTKLSNCHVASLESIRAIADILGYILIPFDLLYEKTYQSQTPDKMKEIQGFKNNIAPFSAFVLAPVSGYSPGRHINSALTDMYLGTACYQHMIPIRLSVPVLQQSIKESSHSRSQMLDKPTAEREVKSLESRLIETHRQIEEDRRRYVSSLTKKQKQLEYLKDAKLLPEQFLMFAVSSKTSLSDNALSFIGPCWGSDFSEVFMNLLGFEEVEGQEHALAENSKRWAKYGYGYSNPERDW